MKIKSSDSKRKFVYLVSFEHLFDSDAQVKKFYTTFKEKAIETIGAASVYLVTLDSDGDLDLKNEDEVTASKKLEKTAQTEGRLVFSVVTKTNNIWETQFAEISTLHPSTMMVVGTYPKFEDAFVQHFYKAGKAKNGFGTGDRDDWDDYILEEENWPFTDIGEDALNTDYYNEELETSSSKPNPAWPMPKFDDDEEESSNSAWPTPKANDDDEEDESDDSSDDEEKEFTCQEINCVLLKYELDEFKKIKLKKEVAKWEEAMNDDRSSYPLYQSSPFGSDDLNLNFSCDEQPEEGIVYVLVHYYYRSSDYKLSGKLTKKSEVKLVPIIGMLMEDDMPMEFVTTGDEELYFECEGSSDGTETMVNVYYNSELISNTQLDEFDEDALKNAISVINGDSESNSDSEKASWGWPFKKK